MIKHKLCTNPQCAHEWDETVEDEFTITTHKCDWCGSSGRTIEVLQPWSMQAMLCLVHKMRKEREQDV